MKPWQSTQVSLTLVLCCLYIAVESLKVQDHEFNQNVRPSKKILVTGIAGFVGFHLAKTLAADPQNIVIGFDNFNDFYDIKLKIDRAYELSQLGITVFYEDLCNENFLEDIFEQHNFTHVAHMAAQAGVRYSLENPLAYIRNNVECQITLLNVLKEYPHTKLVYASSSSVYGKESSIPFRLSANTDQPGNMYAATKKTDELLGYHYCNAYNLSAVGLRFFTVYGPWGRPDMAVYMFGEAIFDKKDVPMFHTSDANPLGRDFTYVDDIISGIVAALDYVPQKCGEKFNLGLGQPVSVPGLVHMLEEEMGIPAKVKKLSLPPTEILRTWADITTSTQLLNFKPKTTLKEGVKKFVAWYRGYRQQRDDEIAAGKPSLSDRWFSRLTEDMFKRGEIYKAQAIEKHNEQLTQRLEHEHEKYLKWAHKNGREVPQLDKGSFEFVEGIDSVGGDILFLPHLKGKIDALSQRCKEIGQCIAFNSNGALKREIRPKGEWTNGAFPKGQGLYISEVDMCKADLHSCSRHAACFPLEYARYECKCHLGYQGSGYDCLPVYGQVKEEDMKLDYLEDYFSVYNVTEMKLGKDFVFFQGLDSLGGDFMLIDDKQRNPKMLQEICRQDKLCIGVNTNGYMKRRIQRKDKWLQFSKQPHQGIYVMDINYCLLDDDACPEHSDCECLGQGDSRCICEVPYIMKNEECFKPLPISPELQPKADPIHTNMMPPEMEVVMSESKEEQLLKGVKQKQNIQDNKDKEGKLTMEGVKQEQHTQYNKDKEEQLSSDEQHKQDIENSEVKNSETIKRSASNYGKNIENKIDDNSGAVHIVFSVDSKEAKIVPVVMNSIILNTQSQVIFHIVLVQILSGSFKNYLSCFPALDSVRVDLIEFNDAMLSDEMKAYIQYQAQGHLFGYLSTYANYARFIFPVLFPTLSHIIYLDVDVIVRDDINRFWQQVISHETSITAAKRYPPQFGFTKMEEVKELYKKRKNETYETDRPSFNAGVLGVNLQKWRQNLSQINNDLNFWMKKAVELNLWYGGNQPLMLVVFWDDCTKVNARWNVAGISWNTYITEEDVHNSAVLHWSGKEKPWNAKSVPYSEEIWKQFIPKSRSPDDAKCTIL